MSRKWRIVFALVTVAAVACAILFFLPKELSVAARKSCQK